MLHVELFFDIWRYFYLRNKYACCPFFLSPYDPSNIFAVLFLKAVIEVKHVLLKMLWLALC